MIKSIHLTFALLLIAQSIFAQRPEKKITREEYIAMYKKDARREMLGSGVPASITLAQALLESDNGNSELAKNALNHFGMKCHAEWNNKTYTYTDDKKDECFRMYKDAFESYADHSRLLTMSKRYDFLFDLDVQDYKGWAKGLQKAGYATDPNYADKLIKIIEDNNLSLLDEGGKKIKRSKELSEDHPESVGFSGREATKVIEHNGLKCVIVKKGDTFWRFSREFKIPQKDLRNFNDMGPKAELVEGQKFYLQYKRTKVKTKTHTVKKGETMWWISQEHGLRLKKLYAKNLMDEGDEPKAGDVIKLR